MQLEPFSQEQVHVEFESQEHREPESHVQRPSHEQDEPALQVHIES
jgi:hypothetical protein